MEPEPVFACDLSALTPGQRGRHSELARRWHQEVQALEELPDGYALVFEPTAERALELAEWMTLERRCCPFLHLAVELAPFQGPLTLRLTGAPGVKPLLTHELDLGRGG